MTGLVVPHSAWKISTLTETEREERDINRDRERQRETTSAE
jgi:hypothetical protein